MTLTACGEKTEENFSNTESVIQESSPVQQEMDYLVLVNRTQKLPDGYENIIELTEDTNFFGDRFRIEKQTYEHFKALREKMLMQEIQIEVNRAYLTADEQTALIEQYTKEHDDDYAYGYLGDPYYSEYQTGLGIDLALYFAGEKIRTNEELMTMTGVFQEIHEILADYGFILRYPEEKVKETDFLYQPWHIRYVGEEAAKEIYQQNLILEEYKIVG